ncbi:hypothetical protein C6H65_11405 [Photorhabdus luminescens]|nr:hypothetical protein C6H65_11405 [Photorhabdus luminescens]
MSPEECGKAKELSQRILNKGLPSVEDMRGKLASCQDDSCHKGVWTEYWQANDTTINSLKQMALNGAAKSWPLSTMSWVKNWRHRDTVPMTS